MRKKTKVSLSSIIGCKKNHPCLIWWPMEVMLPLLVVGNILLQMSQSSTVKMLTTKITLDTFKGTTGFAITLPDSGRQFEGISVCLRFSLFECLDFQPIFGNSQFVLYQSGPHGLGVMQRKVIFSHKIQLTNKSTNFTFLPFRQTQTCGTAPLLVDQLCRG